MLNDGDDYWVVLDEKTLEQLATVDRMLRTNVGRKLVAEARHQERRCRQTNVTPLMELGTWLYQ